MNKIAVIIVSYNRKYCLVNCLKAICRQTLYPDIIYIIDNHSTDATADFLLQNGYIANLPDVNINQDIIVASKKDNLIVKYVYKSENTGGAGGFYTGMKMAYDDGYEWFWMMDDDGVPAPDALEYLFSYAVEYNLHFANSLVINDRDRYTLSFGLVQGKTNINDFRDVDVVYNAINPFNGSFIHRRVPQHIGYIKKEMFIWGDENEYQQRVGKNHYTIGTVTKSIHYHPLGKQIKVNILPFVKKKIIIKLHNFAHFYYRNIGYISYTYSRTYFYKLFVGYVVYFIFHLQWKECVKFIHYYVIGAKNKFN
jgi:GT2 family glycosyltransferase